MICSASTVDRTRAHLEELVASVRKFQGLSDVFLQPIVFTGRLDIFVDTLS